MYQERNPLNTSHFRKFVHVPASGIQTLNPLNTSHFRKFVHVPASGIQTLKAKHDAIRVKVPSKRAVHRSDIPI